MYPIPNATNMLVMAKEGSSVLFVAEQSFAPFKSKIEGDAELGGARVLPSQAGS